MCVTTFLSVNELNIPTSNKELNSVLDDIRKLTTENWQVIERQHTTKRAFGFKSDVRYSYELYKYVGGCGPWQMINFYCEGGESLNLVNSATVVIAFLYGYLAGFHSERISNV